MCVITSENRDAWQAIADRASSNYPAVGKRVRVTKGKNAGKEGQVTWHGRNEYYDNRYTTPAMMMLQDINGREGFRVRVCTATEKFFVNAENVEVIHD
jgi:hypothetical protein